MHNVSIVLNELKEPRENHTKNAITTSIPKGAMNPSMIHMDIMLGVTINNPQHNFK